MGVAPDFQIKHRDHAAGIERGLQLGHHRRPERLPAVLLFAHPLHAHRHAGQFPRNQGSIGRGIVGAVVAVTAGTLDMDQVDARRRHAKHFGDARPVRINTLGMGPDRHRVVDRLRDRTGWADRRMHLERPRVSRLDSLRGPRERRGDVSGVGHHTFGGRDVDESSVKLAHQR